MKVAFVANSHGNIDLLERFLVMLTEHEKVDAIAAVGNAAYDVEAAVRGRQQRFPVAVQWAEPEFPDYVLASVLGGVTEAPETEMRRSSAIQSALFTEPYVELAGLKVGIEKATGQVVDGSDVVVVSRPETAKVRRGELTRVCPGHVRAHEYERAPATCVVFEATDSGLSARFVGVDGHPFGRTEQLSP